MALDGLLRTRAAVVQGIVNGIDDTVWNPATDPRCRKTIARCASTCGCATRPRCRRGWDWRRASSRPLFGVVSRLSDQKGLDLLLQALPALSPKAANWRCSARAIRRSRRASPPRPRRGRIRSAAFSATTRSSPISSRPASDFIVVPSRFEPCGLTQLCALRYGARADRRAGWRPCRHGHRRQRGGDGRWRGDRRPVLSARGRSARPMRSTARSISPAIRRCCGGSGSTACGRTSPGAVRRSGTPRSIAISSGPRHERIRRPLAASSSLRRRASKRRSMLPNAEGAWLCIYDERSRDLLARRWRATPTASCAASRPASAPGARYGFRVEGPYDPQRGRRFDASKLLADPYAWRFDRPFRLHPSMFAFGEDSGPHTPKAIAGAPPAGEPGHKRIAPEALVVYELNLRGFSRLNPAIPEAARGTFAGLAHPAVDRPSHNARRHRGRDHAGGRIRRRAPPAAARPVQRMGLQLCRVRLARSSACSWRLGGGSRGDRRPARRGHGGDPRRRLQPQRRERPVRADAVVPRPRQRRLVPPRSAQSRTLHQRRRHRQLPGA